MTNSAIQQSELWEISRQLVSFNTVSASTNMQAAEYLANHLADSGFAVHVHHEHIDDVQKATVIACAGPEVPGGLIISGHTDVVPFEGQPGWNTNPLEMQTDGQRIFGRGVSDMKVFLAQAIVAARQLSLNTLQRPLVYIFTCDEEVAGQGSGRLIQILPDLFKKYPLPTVALIGEPTNFEIFPAHKGYATFDIRVQGKGGHSSVPDQGINAIEKMADVIHLIQQMNSTLKKQVSPNNARLFPDYPSSVFNCGLIQGGLAANMIAESCQLTTSIRVAPGDNAEAIISQLQEKIEHHVSKAMQSASPQSGVFIENVAVVPPLRSPTEGAFCDLLSHVMGKPLERGVSFATDGGHFQSLGINSYICGPGLLSEAHQPNESLPVANFFTGLERLQQVIHQWCIDR